MKIIKKGRPQTEPRVRCFNFRCRECGCIFTCSESEVDKRDGPYNTTDYYHNCPNCEESLICYQVTKVKAGEEI